MFIIEIGYTYVVLPKEAAIAMLDVITSAEFVKRSFDSQTNSYKYIATPPGDCPEVIMRPLTPQQLASIALSRDQS